MRIWDITSSIFLVVIASILLIVAGRKYIFLGRDGVFPETDEKDRPVYQTI